MLDHFSVMVRDLPASAAFYDAVLAPLGGRRIMEPGPIGYGVDRPDFWLVPASVEAGAPLESHIAFTAPDRADPARLCRLSRIAGWLPRASVTEASTTSPSACRTTLNTLPGSGASRDSASP